MTLELMHNVPVLFVGDSAHRTFTCQFWNREFQHSRTHHMGTGVLCTAFTTGRNYCPLFQLFSVREAREVKSQDFSSPCVQTSDVRLLVVRRTLIIAHRRATFPPRRDWAF